MRFEPTRFTLAVGLGLSLGCGGGFDPVGATVVPYVDADGNTVLSAPGATYPSDGTLAIGATRVFLAYGARSSSVVMAVPKDGGATELIGYPGHNIGGLAVDGDEGGDPPDRSR